MEAIFQILIESILVNFLGLNTRYYFFKLIGMKKSKKDLSLKPQKRSNNFISQYMLNFAVGLIVFLGLGFVISLLF